ncbi:MAG: hypothetical protein CMJ39_02375 [Phycisphaerae bacterium]|nr:hypothetical protein [Phycisphaerae bacterium]
MSKSERKPVLLVLSQVYPPDPASVGQHMADAAEEMVRRGWRVKVLTSARGYNDSSIRYDSREDRNGVEVRRLPLSSFGKRHFLLRALAAILFMLQTIVRGLFAGKSDALLVSTSPPMCIVAALVIRFFRRSSVKFWVMDINPEQLIALGAIKPGSFSARLMDFFNRRILKRSNDVVVLDRFMGDTMMKKLDVKEKIHTMPPWPHEDHLETIPHSENPFRKEHGLDGKFVFMYSGNHGIALPLETFLKAAVTYKDDPRIMFLFIGGGVRKQEVEDTISEHGLTNMVSLPYQPMETLRYSLSSADVHLVSVGDPMVGVIHPCKIYGAMAVGRPILLLGPDPCHVSDLVHDNNVGWHISHGDVDRAIEVIREIADTPEDTIQEMGDRAQQVVREKLSKERLCGMFCDVLEGKA